jgi:hypothetical protein
MTGYNRRAWRALHNAIEATRTRGGEAGLPAQGNRRASFSLSKRGRDPALAPRDHVFVHAGLTARRQPALHVSCRE